MQELKDKILIVDNQASNRLSYENILNDLDIVVIHAASGEEALSLIGQQDIAVILMETSIPGTDGYESIRLIRQGGHFDDISIVTITSAGDDKELYLKTQEAGADDYLPKPITSAALVGKVKQFIELHHKRKKVTERKVMDENLVHLANFDPLTNLANRAYFLDSLTRAVARAKRAGTSLALFQMELDDFMGVNDRLGRDSGDRLLRVIGERLTGTIRAGDIAARIGRDEFAVILYDISSVADLEELAEKIISVVREPVNLSGTETTISASMGVATNKEESMNADQLIKSAETAMYAVKKSGRNNFRIFESKMREVASDKDLMEYKLRDAILNDELRIYYQPKISIATEKIVGLEALVRWATPDGPLMMPQAFIPLAEESGLIIDLGNWVFSNVCKQITKWSQIPGFADLVVSVNISDEQVKQSDFHEIIEAELGKYEIDGSRIELELTETAVMNDAMAENSELQQVHEMGIRISIDDFGKGYSSLNYLQRFPIDMLTIDRYFIEGIGEDQNDEEILKIIIAIARTLNIDVIGEGVETAAQLAFLASMECDIAQGSFFNEPLDTDNATRLIENIETAHASSFAEYHAYLKDNKINLATK